MKCVVEERMLCQLQKRRKVGVKKTDLERVVE